ncbi:hypothetical protein LPJ59_000578 [Coemansia sp. RSA 2399]|nr:hypothetical protein LPJ59_000578 [Coemansia sp. RSA 2399]KAJ1907911.1 hypothetical protein LPJ81_000445 [Coemansia sp. IMI 209127]
MNNQSKRIQPIVLPPIRCLPIPQHINSPSTGDSSKSNGFPEPLLPLSEVYGEHSSYIYCQDDAGFLRRKPVSQVIGVNNKIFIEYVPGTNVIFMPKEVALSGPVEKIVKVKRGAAVVRKLRFPHIRRPATAYLRYRADNYAKIKIQFPDMPAEAMERALSINWREENPDIREWYIGEFNQAMINYKLKIKEAEAIGSHYPAGFNPMLRRRSRSMPPS